MPPSVTTLTLALPLRLGHVNCYLIQTDSGFVLIDTGSPNQRPTIEGRLREAGCLPGDLKLIILTHGDFDHTGNAAYLRHMLGTKIAMHPADFGMIERGDMFAGRSKGNRIFKAIAPRLFKFDATDRVTPDLKLVDGDDLSTYGFNATVISLPGHSQGSIGVLTENGDLFVGDLLDNTKRPGLNLIMDDVTAARASVDKLTRLNVVTIYPGHGAAFSANELQTSA